MKYPLFAPPPAGRRRLPHAAALPLVLGLSVLSGAAGAAGPHVEAEFDQTAHGDGLSRWALSVAAEERGRWWLTAAGEHSAGQTEESAVGFGYRLLEGGAWIGSVGLRHSIEPTRRKLPEPGG